MAKITDFTELIGKKGKRTVNKLLKEKEINVINMVKDNVTQLPIKEARRAAKSLDIKRPIDGINLDDSVNKFKEARTIKRNKKVIDGNPAFMNKARNDLYSEAKENASKTNDRILKNRERNASKNTNTPHTINLPKSARRTNIAMDRSIADGLDPVADEFKFNQSVKNYEKKIQENEIREAVKRQGGRVTIPETSQESVLHAKLNSDRGVPYSKSSRPTSSTVSKDSGAPKIETTSPTDGAVEKDNKFFNQKNIRRGVGVGVTGALVLSMFNNGGQQSNAELYGQQQQRY